MKFTRDEIALLRWTVRDVISRRRLDGHASWTTMTSLEDLYRRLTSADGTEISSSPEQLSTDDLIDTRAAAAILGCSTRWIREIRADLDGQKRGGSWVFPRRMVVEYAELKDKRSDGNRIPPTGGGAVSKGAA